MASQGESEGLVIGDDICGFGRRAQWHQFAVDRGNKHGSVAPRPECRPQRLTSVAGEAGKRIGGGQRVDTAIIQRRAALEVGNIDEGLVRSCCDNARGGDIGKTLYQTQTET